MAKSGGTKRVVTRTTAKTRTIKRPAAKAPAAPKPKAARVAPRQARVTPRRAAPTTKVAPVDTTTAPEPIEHLRTTRADVAGQLAAIKGLPQYADKEQQLTEQLQQLDADIAAAGGAAAG